MEFQGKTKTDFFRGFRGNDKPCFFPGIPYNHSEVREYENRDTEENDDLTFDLGRGEKFLIVGENGVGKSTLLKLIVGQLKPMLGEIVLNQKTEIGYYAQEHELLDNEKIILEKEIDIDVLKEQYHVGDVFEGTVEKIIPAGLIIKLTDEYS